MLSSLSCTQADSETRHTPHIRLIVTLYCILFHSSVAVVVVESMQII